jgi:hypothetical protein
VRLVEFISNKWASILVIIITLIILVLLYKYNRKDLVRKIILSLVVQAEKALGSGTGELKYAYVIDKFYSNLPGILKLLYTPKEIDIYIAEGVSKLKKILSDGVSLSSYDDEIYLDVINKDTID